jgi:hypothetical protein
VQFLYLEKLSSRQNYICTGYQRSTAALQAWVGKSTSGSADLGLHGTISGFHGGFSSFK